MLAEENVKLFHFCLNDSTIKKNICYSHNGIILYSSLTKNKMTRPELHCLAVCLSSSLAHFFKFNHCDLTLVVDNFCEGDFPTSDNSVNTIAYVNRCKIYLREDQLFNVRPVSADQTLAFSLSGLITQVNILDGVIKLKYKRNFLDKTLVNREEIEVVKAIYQQNKNALMSYLLRAPMLIEKLLHKRVLVLKSIIGPQNTCNGKQNSL